jgi:translation initiation factor 1 (eIF-1/SUI1)
LKLYLQKGFLTGQLFLQVIEIQGDVREKISPRLEIGWLA